MINVQSMKKDADIKAKKNVFYEEKEEIETVPSVPIRHFGGSYRPRTTQKFGSTSRNIYEHNKF